MNCLEILETTAPYKKLRNWMNRRLMSILIEPLTHRKDLQVAELACGSAFGSDLLAQNNSVSLSVALDLNSDLYRQNSHPQMSAHFVVGDIFALPFQQNSFDLTWNSSSLEHLTDIIGAIRSMAEVTKEDGYVFVGVPSLFGPLALYYLAPFRSWRTWLGKPYNPNKLYRAMQSAGLAPEPPIHYFFRFFVGIRARKIS